MKFSEIKRFGCVLVLVSFEFCVRYDLDVCGVCSIVILSFVLIIS